MKVLCRFQKLVLNIPTDDCDNYDDNEHYNNYDNDDDNDNDEDYDYYDDC